MMTKPNPLKSAADARQSLTAAVERSAGAVLQEVVLLGQARGRRPSLHTLGPDEPTVKTAVVTVPRG